MPTLEQFKIDQRKALLSLDEAKIRDFARKYGARLPVGSGVAFWGAVHKARTAITSLPIEERRKSKQWLLDNGFTSWDDGDV